VAILRYPILAFCILTGEVYMTKRLLNVYLAEGRHTDAALDRSIEHQSLHHHGVNDGALLTSGTSSGN
jgi:hypothetical protein